jgi:hypothetical protein
MRRYIPDANQIESMPRVSVCRHGSQPLGPEPRRPSQAHPSRTTQPRDTQPQLTSTLNHNTQPHHATIPPNASQIAAQLAVLSTKEVAAVALKNGYAVIVDSVEAAAAMSDRLAVEHVELHVENAMAVARTLKHYGIHISVT